MVAAMSGICALLVVSNLNILQGARGRLKPRVFVLYGGPCWDRTSDHLIKSSFFYSYPLMPGRSLVFLN